MSPVSPASVTPMVRRTALLKLHSIKIVDDFTNWFGRRLEYLVQKTMPSVVTHMRAAVTGL